LRTGKFKTKKADADKIRIGFSGKSEGNVKKN